MADPIAQAEQATYRLYDYSQRPQAFDDSAQTRALFTQSMREMAAFHIEHSMVYRGICAQYGFVPAQAKLGRCGEHSAYFCHGF